MAVSRFLRDINALRICARFHEVIEELLPLVYEELRKLARSRLSKDANQTLQRTELVHEAYLRLVGRHEVDWNGRGHFSVRRRKPCAGS